MEETDVDLLREYEATVRYNYYLHVYTFGHHQHLYEEAWKLYLRLGAKVFLERGMSPPSGPCSGCGFYVMEPSLYDKIKCSRCK